MRRRLGQIAHRAQIIVAGQRAEADTKFVGREVARAQPHRLARRIMACEHPRRDDLRSRDARHRQAARRAQHRGGHRPRPQHLDRAVRHPRDRRFDPRHGRAIVDHQRDPAVEAREHMLRLGRAHAAARIGARRGERRASRGEQCLHRAVSRHAQSNGIEPRRRDTRHRTIRRARHHQRQRPRPERRRERPLGRAEHAQSLGRRQVGDMDDQRVEIGSPLRGIDARDGLRVARVGGKPINRLGRHRDRPPCRDKLRRARNGIGPIGRDLCCHTLVLTLGHAAL